MPWYCKFCEQFFVHHGQMATHMKDVHASELENSAHKCNLCGAVFAWETSLRKHMTLHEQILTKNGKKPLRAALRDDMFNNNNLVPWTCKICNASFSSPQLLGVHRKIHPKTRKFLECDVCQKKFKKEPLFKAHQATHLKTCKVCNLSFDKRCTLRAHLKSHVGEPRPIANSSKQNEETSISDDLPQEVTENLETDFNEGQSFSKDELAILVLTDHPYSFQNENLQTRTTTSEPETSMEDYGLPDESETPEEHLTSSELIEEHVKDSSPTTSGPEASTDAVTSKDHSANMPNEHFTIFKLNEENGVCKDSSRNTSNEQETSTGCVTSRDHGLPSESQMPASCFTLLDLFEEHGLQYESKNVCAKSQCEICGKLLDAKFLKLHLQTHSESKPFSCDLCPMKFKRKAILTMHYRVHVHSNIKTSECNICRKKFRSSSTCSKHAKMHATEKQWSCNVCDKEFFFKNGLQRHLLVHTNDQRHSCEFCSRKFKQMCQLKVHLRTHTKEKPFSCARCKKTFSHKVSLTKYHRCPKLVKK